MMPRILRRLVYLIRQRRMDADLRDELASHHAMNQAEFERSGMSAMEAAYASRRALGNSLSAREDARAVWIWRWADDFWRDVVYTVRGLRRAPSFTAVAALSIALGIGANTAIFSVMDALFWRYLPVRDPHELVQLALRRPTGPPQYVFSYPVVHALAARHDIFSAVSGFTSSTTFSAGEPDATDRIGGTWVTGEYYHTLGLVPILGRLLTTEDDRIGAPPVVVITEGFWRRRFSADPAVVGRTTTIEGRPVTVVGVTPRNFTGATVGQIADLTLPMGVLPQVRPDLAVNVEAGSSGLRVMVRPQVGLSVQEMQVRLGTAWPGIVEAAIPTNLIGPRDRMLAARIEVMTGGTGWSGVRQQFGQPLRVLAMVVGIVLLIACANVASLLLARATARRREIQTRVAIGASRGRLVRQLLTENVILSLIGAMLGIALASWASEMLVHLLSSGEQRTIVLDVTPNLRVLAFTALLATLTGLTFGVLPAFLSASTRSPGIAHGDARIIGVRSRLGSALVTIQVALSLLLLVGAGLFLRTLQNLRDLDPGFRRDNVLVFDVEGARTGRSPNDLRILYEDIRQRLERLPGVRAASVSMTTPLGDLSISRAVEIDGRPIRSQETPFNVIGPRYFETLGTPIVAGRDFQVGEGRGAPFVAIVNQCFARRYLPNGDVLGQHLTTPVRQGRQDFEIVGVVKDAVYQSLREEPPPTVFVPFAERASNSATFEVAAAGSLMETASVIRRDVQSQLPDVALEIGTLNGQIERALARERMMAALASSFAILALTLAGVGLYGLLGYMVERRQNEIGVRTALGARPSDIFRMIVTDGLLLLLTGVALGLPITLAASRTISSMLFGITSTDARTFAITTSVLMFGGIIATLNPARRATKVDPMVVLRCE